MDQISQLMHFLNQAPTAWHAVAHIEEQLKLHGFQQLNEGDKWAIQPGTGYFVTRDGSSLCAFITPLQAPRAAQILASHTDSPGFKVKPQPEIRKSEAVLLGVEIYGAPLLASWLNRDLGIAGRIVTIDRAGKTHTHLVSLKHVPLVIPQLAIHLDREANEKGVILNKQEHVQALAGLIQDLPKDKTYLETIFKEVLGEAHLLTFDLFLFPLEQARLLGLNHQLLASYRIDSLVSVHAILHALLYHSTPSEEVMKMAIFWNHEEIGSHSASAAASPFFNTTLERVVWALGLSREEYLRILTQSHCISVDLGHAVHPNYPDKHDPQHPLFLGKGAVLKSNAQMRYATEASSATLIEAAAHLEKLPLQRFSGRNDIPSGSTIGPIFSTVSGIPTVDMGISQLSMHSARELIACRDYLELCRLLACTFNLRNPHSAG